MGERLSDSRRTVGGLFSDQWNGYFMTTPKRKRGRILCPDKSRLSRNSMNYSFRLSNLGRADQKAFFLLFAPRNVLGTVQP